MDTTILFSILSSFLCLYQMQVWKPATVWEDFISLIFKHFKELGLWFFYSWTISHQYKWHNSKQHTCLSVLNWWPFVFTQQTVLSKGRNKYILTLTRVKITSLKYFFLHIQLCSSFSLQRSHIIVGINYSLNHQYLSYYRETETKQNISSKKLNNLSANLASNQLWNPLLSQKWV